jgi:prepilin-type N-terminal cleavage/methylation domain-containing protein
MKKLFRKKEGFTLIELLIVVAIIGIIAGIAIPNFLGARSKARVTRAFADMRAIADALEMYYVDNTTYPAALADLTTTHITSLPNDVFQSAEEYRYYTNTAATAWLVVSDGPDGDEDEPAAIDWTDRVAGQLGGPDGASSGYGFTWSDGTAGSDGDLGRGGP